MSRLKDKIVLITGASSGLGAQIAFQAAERQAVVVLTARRRDPLETAAKRCQELSGRAVYTYQLDVGSTEQISEVMQKIAVEVGPVDVLVNNAGFGLFAEALDTPTSITEEMFRVNVLGLIHITKLTALGMKQRGSGHIINIASQAGKMATPKSAVYAATKFAVRGYSNALRLELRPFGIYVTTVNTGPMHTNFFNQADPTGSYLNKIARWVLDPQVVAKKVTACMLTDTREINLPRIMEIGARLYVMFPRIGDYLAGGLFNRK